MRILKNTALSLSNAAFYLGSIRRSFPRTDGEPETLRGARDPHMLREEAVASSSSNKLAAFPD